MHARRRVILAVLLLCACVLLPLPARVETRERSQSYYNAIEALGFTVAEATPSPSPTPRVRSDEYHEAMDRLASFSSITSGLFDAGELLYVQQAGPMIALTFDDGPGEYTERILELLDSVGGRATFFMIGNRVNNYKDVVRKVAEQGSEIGNHTWSHPDLTTFSWDGITREITKTSDAITAITGQPVTLMRPPYGSNNEIVRSACGSLGLPLIRWSIDTEDWRTRNAAATYNVIMDEVRENSIILCHDIHAATAEAMEYVIPELARRGYRLVTVSELFAHSGIQPRAGKVYHNIGK